MFQKVHIINVMSFLLNDYGLHESRGIKEGFILVTQSQINANVFSHLVLSSTEV